MSDEASESVRCPKCGGAVPARAKRGLCPACVATALGAALFGDGEEAVAEGVPGYVLGEVLGEGAAGVVWAAREAGEGGREVAVKVLKAGLMAGDARVRFEAEMAVLRMLEHPGIARVYGSGETVDGRPFFALERIDGVGICEHCEAEKLGVRERLVLFQELCLAVGHAHRRGIIHRDLKPSNVLVARGENGGVKVIDFGIAKATERLLTEATLLTRAGELLGTPAFMSPEQVALKGDGVDTRTDVYALGVMLYELLTGALPFGGEVAFEELLRRVREDDPVRPSVRGRERGVDADLDWIVLKAMEKEAGRRYETAEAMARDVGRFLEGDGIKARPPTVGYRVRKYVRKHRVGVGAAGLVLLAMVVATVVSVTMYVRAEGHAERAEASDARGRAVFSRADFLQATPLLDDGRPALAVAHLARALRTDPGNRAASTRLMFTLASENWAKRETVVGSNGRVAFTPDGSKLLMAKHAVPEVEGTHQRFPVLRVFDAESGEEAMALRLGADHGDFAVSPDGGTVVVGTALGVVEVWDLAAGERLRELDGRGDTGCAQVCFSDDGALVACSYWHRGWARVWRVDGWELVGEFQLGGRQAVAGWVDFSGDGRFLGFGFGSGVRVYDVGRGKAISEVMMHGDEVTGVAVVRDGRVASWSRDATARVWDWRDGEAVLVLEHEREVVSGAISPDGSRLLTGTGGELGVHGYVRMWDAETGEAIGEPVRHPGSVRELVFSADGMRAASGSAIEGLGDGAVQVIDGWTGDPVVAPIFHRLGARDLAFSPDGGRLAVSSGELESAVWSLRPTAMRPLRLAHRSPVWRAVFEEREGRATLLTLTFGGLARRWDVVTGELLEGPAMAGDVVVAAFAASGEDALRNGFHVRRWVGSYAHTHPQVDSKFRRTLAVTFSAGEVFSAAASDDGELLVTGCGDGKVRVWSVRTGGLLHVLEHGGGAVTAVALTADGGVAGGGSDGVVKNWSVADGGLKGEARAFDGEVSVVGFSGDGKTLVAGGVSGDVRVWREDFDGGELLGYGGRVNHVAFGPGDGLLAVSGGTSLAVVWDLASGEQVGEMAHPGGGTYGLFLLWSADGSSLVTAGSSDNTARVWDVGSGGMAARPMGQATSAYSVALRPAGGELLYGARSSRVWDTASGEPLTPVLEQDAVALSAAWDGRGEWFATGTYGGSVFVWGFPRDGAEGGAGFLRYAEAIGGFRFNEVGVLETMGVGELEAARQVLRGTGDAWVDWLVADGKRPVGPGMEIGEDALVDSLVAAGDVGSLGEAMSLRPGDAGLMLAFAKRIVEDGDGRARGRARTVGRFLARRATALDAGLGDEAARVVLAAGGVDEAVLIGARRWLAGSDDVVFAELLEAAGWRESAPVVRDGGEGAELLREVFGEFCEDRGEVAMRLGLAVLKERSEDRLVREILARGGVLMGSVGDDEALAMVTLREGIGVIEAAGGDPLRLRGAVWRLLRGMRRDGEARQVYLGIRGIPGRSEEESGGAVALDLSEHYNRGLGEGDYGGRSDSNDLRSLEPGYYEFGGLRFDVRGVVQLASGAVERMYPGGYAKEVEIGVGVACRRIGFVHGASYAAVPGVDVASYVIRYEDGEVVEIPLRVGEEIADWWMDAGAELPGAEIVWRGENPESQAEGKVLGLQMVVWENPEPERVVESVVFRSALEELARPFLVAVTVE